MSLVAGTRLGVYEILAPLGAGGMGEVYRARDSKLDRSVAIKVLPEEFGQETERLARFEREARLLAQLTHPNIATLYGFEEHEGTPYLVMELVEGETLGERIRRGPLTTEEAIPLFLQIGYGLEAAHDKGIVHRDLKPGNIKITPQGTIKVLDFGLAKALLSEADARTEASQSPTLTRGTAFGAILGTAAYMSPEQARGNAIDERSDIWAFGCCLYEALTGKKAFDGATVTDVLTAILHVEPDWTSLPSGTATRVRRTLSRCLRKDPESRVHHIADARIELAEADDETPPTTPSRTSWRSSVYALTALLGVLAVVSGLLFRVSSPTPRPVSRLDINLPEDHELPDDYSPVFALSPDGRQLVYETGSAVGAQFFLRALDDFSVRPVAAEDGNMPFFSPDGEWLGFYSRGKLQRAPVGGGAPLAIAQAPRLLSGGSWGRDGSIVIASPGSGLRLASVSGGVLERLGDARNPFWPHLLPDARGVIFTARTSEGFRPAVYSFQTGEWRYMTLIGEGRGARYVPSGHIVYAEGGQLLAAPFDLEQLDLGGVPKAVVEDVYTSPTSGLAYFDISDSGTLAYVPEPPSTEGDALVLVDRSGKVTRTLEEGKHFLNPHFSPDSRRLAVTLRSEANRPDIWILDLESDTRSRLTSTRDVEQALWTPDGERITYVSARDGVSNIYWKPVDGSSDEEPLLVDSNHDQIGSWTKDGRLAFMVLDLETGLGDLWVLDSRGETSPLVASPFHEQEPSFSPDGRWFAFASDETGRDEIYVQRTGVSGGKRPISTNGGREPIWSRDGRELFYRQGNAVMSVSVQLGNEITAEKPRVLFEDRFLSPFMNPSVGETTYDVSSDGQTFVMVEPSIGAKRDHIHVVQNWVEELERLVPTLP